MYESLLDASRRHRTSPLYSPIRFFFSTALSAKVEQGWRVGGLKTSHVKPLIAVLHVLELVYTVLVISVLPLTIREELCTSDYAVFYTFIFTVI